jgi:hypothetical protein
LTKDKITGGKIIWLIIRFLVQILAGISHNNVSMVVGLGLVVRENVGATTCGCAMSMCTVACHTTR